MFNWTTVKNWYAQPFSSSMSATQWFLFLGLLIAIMAGWRVILAHIQRDV